MSRKSKKKPADLGGAQVELNVMPFVDIFSLLCTFLLFSAVFVAIGILEVQIPFLSNAAPSEDKNEDKRQITLKIEIEKMQVELTTSFTKPPINQEKKQYPNDANGLRDLHKDLLDIKSEHQDSDKVNLFVDDDIIYDNLIKVLDQIKLRFPGDLGYNPEADSGIGRVGDSLYSKVVMGNVLL